MTIDLVVSSDTFSIPAAEKNGNLYVDAVKVAEGLGAKATTVASGVAFKFPKFNVTLNLYDSTYLSREKGTLKKRSLKDSPLVLNGIAYVSLASLKTLFRQDFVYHLQRKVLSPASSEYARRGGEFREIPVKHRMVNQKLWVDVQSLADALGVVVYSAQTNRFNLVLPDFSILELRVGEKRVYKRQDPYRILEDPVLLLSGSPHISLASIEQVFGLNATWNNSSKKLIVSAFYGRLKELEPADVQLMGYEPEKFKVDVERVSVYYQEPAPTHSAQHDQAYESVRDFLTNDPIDPGTKGFGRVSGETLVGATGSLFKAPLETRGLFEKLGQESQLVNGTVEWGFPLLHVKGAREYVTFGGLNNQFDSMDQAILSHSTDHYGDGDKNPQMDFRMFYGQHDFTMFMSSSLFSQTVDFRQRMAGGAAQARWDFSSTQKLGVNIEHYHFSNETKEISSEYHVDDFLAELLGSDLDISASAGEERSLISDFLTQEHSTTLTDVNYMLQDMLQASLTFALSHYREDSALRPWTVDHDVKARAVVGSRARRVDFSFERVGPRYKSIGNPLRYQDKTIYRAAPYWDFNRIWKVFGEFRHEVIGESNRPGILKTENTFAFLGNSLLFSQNAYSFTATHFNSKLFGRRWDGSFDYTRYIGRDSLGFGSTLSSQWTSSLLLFRRSYGGRINYQILRPGVQISAGQELTQIYYNTVNKMRWESLSKIIVQYKKFRSNLQYEIQPKYFLEEDVLHTAHVRVGRQAGKNKMLNLFYTRTSLNANLSDPEIWRLGLEWTADFY